jgi:hypothetical protein
VIGGEMIIKKKPMSTPREKKFRMQKAAVIGAVHSFSCKFVEIAEFKWCESFGSGLIAFAY